MKKIKYYFLVFLFMVLVIPSAHAEELTCYYNMGENNPEIIVTVDENQEITAREDVELEVYPIQTSYLVYERFLASGKTVLKCPNYIYRAKPQLTFYEICSEREMCAVLDETFIMGELNTKKSSSAISIDQDDEDYMSCEYQSNGGLPETNNAHILFTVKNGVPRFSIQYGSSSGGTIRYNLTPTDDFEIASSCEEQGSLWIGKSTLPNKTISSGKDFSHSIEMTLVSEEDKKILDQDETDKKNGKEDTKPGFTPKKLCENGNCDISLDGFCDMPTVSRTLKFLGILVYILKILVPALIILMGMRSLFQIITTGKTEDAKKYVVSILKRIVIGVVIFLLPSLLGFVYDLANGVIGSKENNKANNCVNCLLTPFNEQKCKIKEN